MAVSFDPLWKLLIDKKMRKLDLCKEVGISTSTLAKMGKNKYVSLEVLEKICITLECRIEEVIEITGNKIVE